MRKKFVQIAALCLIFACMLTAVGQAFFIPDDGSGTGTGGGTDSGVTVTPPVSGTPSTNPSVGEQIIRVGIYYGNDALDGINMDNETSEGFYFGYYDSSNQFVKLASTAHNEISVVKTENVYYGTGTLDGSSYNCYYDHLTSASVAVGCYHLELAGTYSTFEEAKAAADIYADHGSFVAYVQGSFYVRIGNYVNRGLAESAVSTLAAQGITASIVGTSAYGITVVKTGTNTIVFQYDDNGNGTGLGVQAVCHTAAKSKTWFARRCWYGGFRYERINGGNLTIVNMVALDDYVKGVIPYEMGSNWEKEALKALAVCARNYAVVNANRHGSHHFGVCNETCCQVYLGIEGNKGGAATEFTDSCVEETAGMMVRYNGDPIGCYYYSSNGGASEDSSVVWGSNQASYPYLLGVIDSYESAIASSIPNYNWTREFTGSELQTMLRSCGYNSGVVVSAAVSAYTDTGNPKTITFKDNAGLSFTINTAKFVSKMNLRSYRYDFGTGEKPEFSVNGTDTVSGMSGLYAVDGNGNMVALSEGSYVITADGVAQSSTGSNATTSSGKFLVSGKGYGHNVGLSQYGAQAMAKQGFTYDQILTFYYTGVTVG